MTLDQFSALILSVDGNAQHYASTADGSNYTVWAEYQALPDTADNLHYCGYKIQVDRYTKDEDDDIAHALFSALDSADEVSFTYMIEYERQTGYIHHIYDCEVT